MRTWERVRIGGSVKCGSCSARLLTGAPVLLIQIPGGTLKPVRLYRCVACEGPAPADLPALVDGAIGTMGPPVTLRPWAEMQELARQWEREPGEEG